MKNEKILVLLKGLSIKELGAEIGRRKGIEHGKIQISFHKGTPSEYMQVDMSVPTEDILPIELAKLS
jgi:hypothetical protein